MFNRKPNRPSTGLFIEAARRYSGEIPYDDHTREQASPPAAAGRTVHMPSPHVYIFANGFVGHSYIPPEQQKRDDEAMIKAEQRAEGFVPGEESLATFAARQLAGYRNLG